MALSCCAHALQEARDFAVGKRPAGRPEGVENRLIPNTEVIMRRPNRQFVAGHLEGDLSACMALLIPQSRFVGPRFRLRTRLAGRGRAGRRH
jgi:hypothetical protein